MWPEKDFLEECFALHELGFKPKIEVGSRVARGFADLGSEVFLLLSANETLSLFTGEKRTIPERELSRLCWVPTVDELVEQLHSMYFTVSNISTRDQRTWEISLTVEKTGTPLTFQASSIELALIKALRNCFEQTLSVCSN
ncbi:MAG: hypothetical protein KDD53_06870 [Bdellovibrionales bacterium]|nr:hypothetical protein [Bdellovibrionales bacterium]